MCVRQSAQHMHGHNSLTRGAENQFEKGRRRPSFGTSHYSRTASPSLPHALRISNSSSPRNTLQTHRASSRHSSLPSAPPTLPTSPRSRSPSLSFTCAPKPRQTTTARTPSAPTSAARSGHEGRTAAARLTAPRNIPTCARAVCAWCARR